VVAIVAADAEVPLLKSIVVGMTSVIGGHKLQWFELTSWRLCTGITAELSGNTALFTVMKIYIMNGKYCFFLEHVER
jgi:hypothetical protein